MAVDAAGSSIAYVTGAALQDMGLPAGTSTVLAAIVSGGITYSAGRYFLKDEAGNVIAEYTGAELDRILKGEMDGLERSGLSAIKGIDNLDSLDGVMIKYKDGKYVISDVAGKEISATGKELDSILKGSADSINGSSITFKITDIDALKGGTATYRNGKYIICDATGKEIQECTVTELEKILKGEVKSIEGLPDIPAVKGSTADDFIEGGADAIDDALKGGRDTVKNNLVNNIQDIREQMPNTNLAKRGNMAAADVDVPGVKDNFVAHSKINAELDKGADVADFSYLKPENERIFTAYVDDQYPRYHDTEAKILEDIASQITDPDVSGTINLYSELPCCQSCSNIILEFRRMFPNIELNIFVE